MTRADGVAGLSNRAFLDTPRRRRVAVIDFTEEVLARELLPYAAVAPWMPRRLIFLARLPRHRRRRSFPNDGVGPHRSRPLSALGSVATQPSLRQARSR